MKSAPTTFEVSQGMPLAVWQDKYARKKPDGTFQSWSERVKEVVEGNFCLDRRQGKDAADEFLSTLNLATQGIMAFSGRHLQHGDTNQEDKIGEVFTNCSTAMFSFLKFWLLLKGSGVGRCYDNDICFVNWDFMPHTRFVISSTHADYKPESGIETLEEAKHKYDSDSEHVRWFTVDDSVEGWAKVVEILETAAFHKHNLENLFIFDFTQVRPFGAPIWSQQGRPSSGPIPLIHSLQQVASVKGAGWKPWKQALFIDHYLSSCVVVGGIRRSARIATKNWRDRDVFEFIDIKRGGWLFTANNSIAVDKDFWDQAANPSPSHARRVFEYAVSASYYDHTGEPGFLNVDKLTNNTEGMEGLNRDNYLNLSFKKPLDLHPKTLDMVDYMLRKVKQKKYAFICNPCGEITLACYGGYCVIGDINLSRVTDLGQALEAAHLMARFLIRTNLMPYLYSYEVKRTNRIGVSLTGIHEFAYKMFDLSFKDIVNNRGRTQEFKDFLVDLRETVELSAISYANALNVNEPHTMTCIKPSGTVSKVMNCTEGAHLPAMAYYMRWVQFPKSNATVKELTDRGYPMKDISAQYKDHVVVGFPTCMAIAELMGSRLTTAGQATPEEQYKWLSILEETWIGNNNNQISYTLKYDPKKVTRDEYMEVLLKYQSQVKACAIMPQEDTSAYIYLPEQELTRMQYDYWIGQIDRVQREQYDEEALMCDGGACPIENTINV